MLKSYLVSPRNKRKLSTAPVPGRDEDVLLTERPGFILGSFKSATRASAGTTIITQPNGNGAIILTDMIFSSDKVNGATVTVQFTDGANTVVIFAMDVTDAAAVGAIGFQGHWQGWQAARLDLVTTGAVTATVAVGYYKVTEAEALTYAEWDARR